MSPFKPKLWFSCLGLVLGFFVSFRIIIYFIKHYVIERSYEGKRDDTVRETASDSFMWILSGVCKQGGFIFCTCFTLIEYFYCKNRRNRKII